MSFGQHHRRSKGRKGLLKSPLRFGLAAGVAVLGYLSVTHSLANVLVKVNPANAHALFPGNGRITAKLADASFTTADTSSNAAELAKLALRQDPTAVAALDVLGMQSQLQGNPEQARRIFLYSKALSRRELRAHIWAIEDAVTRGDIAGALDNYDIAFRSSTRAQDTLFPALASAIGQNRVRREVVEDLVQEPVWGPEFIRYLTSTPPDANSARLLLQDLGSSPLIGDAERTAVVNAQAKAGDWDGAWEYFETFRAGAKRTQLRNGDFSNSNIAPSFFDWAPVNDNGISVSIEKDSAHFAVAPAVGGILLQQMQMMPTGDYRLNGVSAGVDQPESSLPYWEITCRSGLEIARITVTNSKQNNGAFGGHFTVPAGCPVQTLSLTARPSTRLEGTSGTIERIEIMRQP